MFDGIRQKGKSGGVLHIVATPIGNLEDITLRALRVLKEADWIAAEDTRRTRKLLSHYGISKRMESLHGDVERMKTEKILRAVSEGCRVAIVSDAGTPGASDPGGAVVRAAVEAGLRVEPVPGASAIVAAVSVAGIKGSRFAFEGFLPRQRSKRKEILEKYRGDGRAVVFFESPKRVKETLEDVYGVLGDRNVAISRELTKLHETIVRTRLERVAGGAVELPERGEYTIVVEGADEKIRSVDGEEVSRVVEILLGGGMSGRGAAAAAAELLGVPRKAAYGEVLKLKRRGKDKAVES
ncbi:MAG: 16S rRNA (cytidine(1402)-2'-O)-methyltransferase [bacterium]